MTMSDNIEGFPTIHVEIRQMMELSLGRPFSVEERLGSVSVQSALDDVMMRLDEAERDMYALENGHDIPDSKLDYPAMTALFTLVGLVKGSEDLTP